jgi:hypothetical protein
MEYLENAYDYASEAFESANEWMKENDPLKFPEVNALCVHFGHPELGYACPPQMGVNSGSYSGVGSKSKYGCNSFELAISKKYFS